MERFSRRESVLLGYSPQRSFLSSPKSASGDTDTDSNDVFGGRQRRSSIQEPRYSFVEAATADSCGEDETASSVHKRWSGLNEKPVFGEEVLNRRRYPSNDFFYEPLSSLLRQHDRNPSYSTPGSGVLSPIRPLPPRADPFGSSSLPAQFSLPAKLTKDLPTFGSGTRNHQKSKDASSDGMGYYSYSPLSRFSGQANQAQELRNDTYQLSCLSLELPLNVEDSSDLIKPDETDKGGNLKTDADSYKVPTGGSQFHFSIYKWASKGIPSVMPIRGGTISGLKEKRKSERSSSANGWKAAREQRGREVTSEISREIDSISCNDNVASDASFGVEPDKQENGSLLDSNNRSKAKQSQVVEVAASPRSASECQVMDEDIGVDTISQKKRTVTEVHYVPDTVLSGKMEEEAWVVTQEAPKTDLKPQHSHFFDNDYDKAADVTNETNEWKERKVKITKKSSAVFRVGENFKKQDERRTTPCRKQMDRANVQGSPANTRDNIGRNTVRGKVKEFVKIFLNREASNTAKNDANRRNRSSRKREKTRFMTEDDASITSTKMNEKTHLPDGNKNDNKDAFTVMDEYLKQYSKRYSKTRTDNNSANATSGLKDQSAATAASIPFRAEEAVAADGYESFQGHFLIKEASSMEDKLLKADDDYDDIRVLDAKIRRWSLGKEGNIRSLLSTLQYVLWPESGWKPVPLFDIIEGSAVKRTYQKALLYLHPDKLQQICATSHQKYMAEKVFVILQEAWIHFGALGSL